MSNKPVAWIKQGKLGYPVLEFDKPFRYESYAIQNSPIPLYTHQYERPHNTVLVPCDKLAEMQAEIEALKQIIDANNLNQNIGQFVKPTNEPVAWISRLPEGDVYNCAWAEKQNDDDIPLYTHPVKEEHFEDEPQAEELHEIMQSNAELTDEKIDECSCFVNVELSQRYGSIESIDDIDWTITGLRAFAKAILRKASEK